MAVALGIVGFVVTFLGASLLADKSKHPRPIVLGILLIVLGLVLLLNAFATP